MFGKQFVFIITWLISANVITTVISYLHAGGDKGWWPFYFLLVALLSVVYAAIFSSLACWKNIKIFPAGYIHILLAVLSVVLTLLYYYADVDWLAVNNGAAMSWYVRLVNSDLTMYFLHIACFFLLLVVVLKDKYSLDG